MFEGGAKETTLLYVVTPHIHASHPVIHQRLCQNEAQRCGRPSRGALIRFMGSWESNVERLIMCFRPVTVRGFGNCFCCRNCIVSTANSMNSYETHWTSFPWTTTVSTHHLHRRRCSPCPHLRKGSIICDVGCFSHCFKFFFRDRPHLPNPDRPFLLRWWHWGFVRTWLFGRCDCFGGFWHHGTARRLVALILMQTPCKCLRTWSTFCLLEVIIEYIYYINHYSKISSPS